MLKTIFSGFPKSKKDLEPLLHDFWTVRDRLSAHNNIALFDQRLVNLKAFRKCTFSVLHSAHQGVTNIQTRANVIAYWPGMNASIRNTRYTCQKCNKRFPSQSQEPIVPTPAPGYPFQKVCANYFEVQGHSYLTYVDRFSGWISIFHFKPHQTTSQNLISECCSLFENYWAPEKFNSDGGLQFTSKEFQSFLKDWGVFHRNSSANGRAELTVKVSKKIIIDNTSKNGDLNNNKAARAILQYHNTPIPKVGLSPTQTLFHRQLRDHIPTNPKH